MNFNMIPLAKHSLLVPCAFLALACCTLVPGTCSADDGKVEAFLDAQMLVDGWEASYCHIDSFKVRCARIMLDEKGQNPSPYKITRSIHQERIQDGSKFLIRTGDSPQAFDGTGYYQVSSFDGSVGRDYRQDRGQARGRIYRGLAGRASETMDMLEYFLESNPDNELNSKEEPRWKALKEQYPLGIPSFFGWYNGALDVKVRPYLESVAGESCHVLELDFEGYSRAYWFAHEKGMLPMKKKLVLGGGKEATKEVKEIASVATDTGILWYPRVIMEEQIRGPNYSYTMKATFDEYVPHFKAPDETFSYVFPNGTRVYDSIKDVRYYIGSRELEKDMTPAELDILESGPEVSETTPVSLEKDNESEEPEDVHTDVAQEQPAQISNNDESQETESHLILWLLGIAVAASVVLLMKRGVLSRKKTIK